MKKLKKIFLTVVCVLILFSILYNITKIVIPKYTINNNDWPTTASYNQFYKMKKNSIDVLFLGSSVCVNGFSPQEIYNNYGIRSYNLGSEQQSPAISYFWLNEALRFQSPKAVVLDIKFCYSIGGYTPINMPEGLIRKCIDPMKWSHVKREAVKEICTIDPSQSKASYYLKNIRFHDRWKNLTESDFNEYFYNNSFVKGQGFVPFSEMGPEHYEALVPSDPNEREEMSPKMKEYLDRIVQLCKEKNIELILVNIPGNATNDGIHNTFTEYASKNNIAFYDLCEKKHYDEIGAILPKERTMDHANIWGAVKLSNYIGKILKDEFHVPSVIDEQYEETKDYYQHIKKSADLQFVNDFDEYLDKINDERYSIFISIKDEGTEGLEEKHCLKLKELGLKTDFRNQLRTSYLAVILPDKIIENVSEEALFESGQFRKQRDTFSISSAGYDSGNNSSIIINEIEYSKNLRGMNIVVYDNELLKVVDSVNFDTHTDCVAHR